MKRKQIFIFLMLFHTLCHGQEPKKYYLKLALGSKWNVWDNDEYNTMLMDGNSIANYEPFTRVDEAIKVSTYSELILGVPLTHYAHIETGIIKNDFKYGRSIKSFSKNGKTLEIPIPDLQFTTWQIPIRLRTSINLFNKRFFLLNYLGFSDVLSLLTSNNLDIETSNTIYTFNSSGYLGAYSNPTTFVVNIVSAKTKHPSYIELGAGMEWYARKNFSVSVTANYNISTNNNQLYKNTIEINNPPILMGYYSQNQNTIAFHLLFGIHYYFKNKFSTWFKPFDTI